MKKFQIVLTIIILLLIGGCKKDKKAGEVEEPSQTPKIAEKFIFLVDNLGEVSLNSKDELNVSKQFYLTLDANIKSLTEVNVAYQALEEKISKYLELYELTVIERSDETIIQAINEIMAQLPIEAYITIEDRNKINEAEELFLLLSEPCKVRLSDTASQIEKLKNRYLYLITIDQATYQKIYFIAKANLYYQDIDNLTLTDQEKITSLNAVYEALQPDAKQESDVLEAYELSQTLQEKINNLLAEKALIDNFLEKVYALPSFDDLRYQDQNQKALIANCYQIYQTFTENQKTDVSVVNAYTRLNAINQTFNNLKEPYDITLCNVLYFHNNNSVQKTPVEIMQTTYGYNDQTLKEKMIIYLNFYIEGGAKPSAPFYSWDITGKKTITSTEVFAKLKELSTTEGYEMVVSGQHYCFSFKIESLNEEYGSSYYTDFFSRMVITF